MTNKYLYIPLGLFGITVLSGALVSSVAFADNDNVVDQVSITVPISCTLSGSGMTSHNANIANGTYQANIGSTTLTAFCNDNAGFSIYAAGYTGNEIGATNSNKLVGTSSSNNATIDTGTATTAGNPDISNWAMKLTAASSPTPTYPITITSDTGGSFSSYHAVPNEYTKVATRLAGTDIGTNAEGSTLTTTYAAYISKTQPADTYSGQVKYTLVHPESEVPAQPVACTAGKICYNANTSAVTGQMKQQAVSEGANVTLYASNFKRDGYGFAGWNDKYDYTGTFYGPNQTITVPTGTSANGLSLYAVWVKSAGTIQNWNGCSSLTQDPNDGTANLTSVTALTDERDNNTYAVARLTSGKCWTIENLRLADKDANNNDISLSSTNTHNPSLPLTNIYDSNTTSNHLSPTSSVPYDATNTPEGWCISSSTACNDQSRLRTDNTTLFINNTSSNYNIYGDVYSYGNYYNWYSATAGHGKYGNNYGSGYIAPGDICPAGWHLPTGNTTGEYYALGTVSSKLRSYPSNFVYSGSVLSDSVSNRNYYGVYWSSSAYDGGYAYYLYLTKSYAGRGMEYDVKYYGRAVRCVAGV